MELNVNWVRLVLFFIGVYGGVGLLKWIPKRLNGLIYETKLVPEIRRSLPPGDMGWPLIGNMWSFLRAFKSTEPDVFIRSFVDRYGRSGVYKCFMFGKPSVIVTTPEACKKVLTDDEAFKPGWPLATVELVGRRSFVGISYEEHKWLRRLTAAPVNGPEALSVYLKYIEENVKSGLEKWATLGPIEFLTQLRKLTFKIIVHIFLGSESEVVMEALEREYTALNYGVRAMAINIPGFAYHKALKARKKLVQILQTIVTERRNQKKWNGESKKKDMMDALLDAEDEHSKKLTDEDIIDVLIMYLNAGHESSGHTMMWATMLLQQHPQVFRRAKEEQEEIMKRRSPSQKGLTLKEIREMQYLSKVIDETLRIVSFSLMVFREAKTDVNVCGYIIPKGWRVLVWFRSVHMDPSNYLYPKEYNPDRWDIYTGKAGTFLPFGAGSRLCPGNDLAKLEITVFLHHFLLGYQLERLNPDCPLMYLPHPRPKDNCLARIKKIPPPCSV